MNKVIGQIFSSENWKYWRSDFSGVEPLPGEYAVEFFNGKGQISGVVRDPLGLQPVYYSKKSHGVYYDFKSAVDKEKQLHIDWEFFYGVFAENFCDTNRSPYQEIKRLPPGHILDLTKAEPTTKPFFSTVRPNRQGDLKDLYHEIVKERASHCTSPLTLFISGGLDSSLLYASLCQQNLPFHALHLHISEPESSGEAELQLLERQWKKSIVRIRADDYPVTEFLWDPSLHHLPSPTLNMLRPLLQESSRLGSSSVWTGIGADQTFVCNSRLLALMIQAGDFRQYVQGVLKRQRDGLSPVQIIWASAREFLPLEIRKGIDWLRPLNNDLQIPGVSKLIAAQRKSRIKTSRYSFAQDELIERFYESGQIAFAAEHEQMLAEIFAQRFSYPYLDLRFIAHAMTLEPQEWFCDGLEKWSLRQWSKKFLPLEIAMNDSIQTYSQWSRKIQRAQKEQIMKQAESLTPLIRRSRVPLRQITMDQSQKSQAEFNNHLDAEIFILQSLGHCASKESSIAGKKQKTNKEKNLRKTNSKEIRNHP